MIYLSTKIIPLGSTTFRQWRADSHCKYIHGYRLLSKIWFTADKLDKNNWVFGIGDCKRLKYMLEYQFDHTFCCAADDPEIETFRRLEERGLLQLRVMEEAVGIEATAKWVFNLANNHVEDRTRGRAWVSKVEVWEHEGNSAIYEIDK